MLSETKLQKTTKIDISNIPEKIGVYLFKDKNNKVLYVGKSLNLKKRIRDHLLSSNPKIKELINSTKSIEYLTTDSEAAALLKEAELIKKFDPIFNHILKDDTQYFYVCFTKETYPKIVVTHQPQKYLAECFGPFTEGRALRVILKIIRKEIPFCTCLQPHKRSCLNSLLGLCYGWCCKVNEQGNPHLYKKNIEKIKKILRGDFKKIKLQLLKALENELKNNNLEKAEKIRREIIAINKIVQSVNLFNENIQPEIERLKVLKQLKVLLNLKSLPHIIEAYDISHLAGTYKVGMRVVFKDGKYDKEGLRRFRIKTILKPDDARMIYEVLIRRLNHLDWGTPSLIFIDGGKIQFKFALKALKEKNLDDKIKIISFAKPQGLLYYDLYKKPLVVDQLPISLKNFIKLIEMTTHKAVIKYHKKLREKING